MLSGRGGSKPPAGSNKSKDWRLLTGAGFLPARAFNRDPACPLMERSLPPTLRLFSEWQRRALKGAR
jgi:hypothetical protein